MEEFIQEYLSIYYKIAYSDLGNAGIYDINKNPKYKAPEYGKNVIKEISKVFFINEEEAKNQINIWTSLIVPNVDLEFYWKESLEFAFPLAKRVAAQLIGHDLVSVQPMSAPNYNYLYGNQNQIISVSSRGFDEISHPTDAVDAIWNSILTTYSGRT